MLTAKLILERLDKEGRLLERREQLSRSFLKNFIDLLYCYHAQVPSASPISMTDIGGTPQSVDGSGPIRMTGCYKAALMMGAPGGHSQVLCCGGQASSGSDHEFSAANEGHKGEEIGIQVGTGVTAVTPTDYAMATRIAHGRGAGQLEYGGCELVNIVFVNPNGEFTIRRYFTNHSGGSITVNEVGIQSPAGQGTAIEEGRSWIFIIARDLTGGIAVADTQLLRVTYVPQITV